MTEPFWEASYQDADGPPAFGPPSQEIHDLVPDLPPGATVLDLGCGDGRNAVLLLEHGFHVTAIDNSRSAIAKLVRRAGANAVRLSTVAADLASYEIGGMYDLVIAHGLLQFLPVSARDRLLTTMKAHTRHGGYNVVAVFTDALPPPADLRPFMTGLFREGELAARYGDWQIVLNKRYILEDEHGGGIRHRHPVNKVVARRPMNPSADFDIEALYDALDAQRQARGMSWQQVARAISGLFVESPARPLSASTMTGMRKRKTIEGDGVLQMLRWLGRSPESFVPGHEPTAPLPDVRADQILRFDTARLYAAMDARRSERAMTWTDVALEIQGVTATSLTQLSRGGRTGFPQVTRIARWLGVPVATFARAYNR